MKILLWQASILPDMQLALEQFANTSVLQFFKQQKGCMGISFLQNGHQLQCLSYWQSYRDAQNMLQSYNYQQLLTMMLKRWIVACNPAEYVEIQGGFITEQALQKISDKHDFAQQGCDGKQRKTENFASGILSQLIDPG